MRPSHGHARACTNFALSKKATCWSPRKVLPNQEHLQFNSLHKFTQSQCVIVCGYSAQHHSQNLISLVLPCKSAGPYNRWMGILRERPQPNVSERPRANPSGWRGATRRQRGVHREKVATGGVVGFNGAFCVLQFPMPGRKSAPKDPNYHYMHVQWFVESDYIR